MLGTIGGRNLSRHDLPRHSQLGRSRQSAGLAGSGPRSCFGLPYREETTDSPASVPAKRSDRNHRAPHSARDRQPHWSNSFSSDLPAAAIPAAAIPFSRGVHGPRVQSTSILDCEESVCNAPGPESGRRSEISIRPEHATVATGPGQAASAVGKSSHFLDNRASGT